MGIRILSTKKLNVQQTERFQKAGIELLQSDFITSQPIDFLYNGNSDLLVFTSKNAVKSIVKSTFFSDVKNVPTVCVGHQTKELLENFGFTVLKAKNYAEELADFILEKFSGKKITHFCGNIRRPLLREKLQENNFDFTELIVYETVLSPHKIDNKVNGILFFSPSGIQSYLQKNAFHQEICFCIGNTTADALVIDKKQIQISQKQDIDAVVALAIEYFADKI